MRPTAIDSMLDRRSFLATSLTAALSAPIAAQQAESPKIFDCCAFVKFLQDLAPTDLARTVAQLGYSGIEATVRKRGQIEPERVADELPGLVEALRKASLEVTIMASDVNRADNPLMEKTLRTAATLGIKRYRMSYYRYDLQRPIRSQIDQFRPMAKELAALNQELGMQAIYQNHAGAKNVGASLWDLDLLLEGIDPQHMAIGFDIRHATVEGGTTWPTLWKLSQPRLGAVYVKDFVWRDARLQNVALGSGRVDPEFFSKMASKRADVPFTVHVEYLRGESRQRNVAALGTDLKTFRRLLARA